MTCINLSGRLLWLNHWCNIESTFEVLKYNIKTIITINLGEHHMNTNIFPYYNIKSVYNFCSFVFQVCQYIFLYITKNQTVKLQIIFAKELSIEIVNYTLCMPWSIRLTKRYIFSLWILETNVFEQLFYTFRWFSFIA